MKYFNIRKLNYWIVLLALSNMNCFANESMISVFNGTDRIIPKITVSLHTKQGSILTHSFLNVPVMSDEMYDTFHSNIKELLSVKYKDIKHVNVTLEDNTIEKIQFPILVKYFRKISDFKETLSNDIISKITTIATYDEQEITDIKHSKFRFRLLGSGDKCDLSIDITNTKISASFTEFRPNKI